VPLVDDQPVGQLLVWGACRVGGDEGLGGAVMVPCADLLAHAVREMWVGGTVADGLPRLVDLSWPAGQILQRSAPGQGGLLDRSHKSAQCATDLETSCLAVPIVIKYSVQENYVCGKTATLSA